MFVGIASLVFLAGCGSDEEKNSVPEIVISSVSKGRKPTTWQEAEIQVNSLVTRIGVVGESLHGDFSLETSMDKINELVDSINLSGLPAEKRDLLEARIAQARSIAAKNFYGYITAEAEIENFSEIDREQAKLRDWAARKL